jgi:hypothetical protein
MLLTHPGIATAASLNVPLVEFIFLGHDKEVEYFPSDRSDDKVEIQSFFTYGMKILPTW